MEGIMHQYDPICPYCNQGPLIVEELHCPAPIGMRVFSPNQVLTPTGPAGTVKMQETDEYDRPYWHTYAWNSFQIRGGRVRCTHCSRVFDLARQNRNSRLRW
jgi:hypothetical protein